MGEFPVSLSYKYQSCTQYVYMVGSSSRTYLPFGHFTQADIIQRAVPDQYPGLFTGLPDSYKIKLKPDAQPLTLFTLRNVPPAIVEEG